MSTSLDTALTRFDSLTRHWKPDDDRSFQDYAQVLTLATELRSFTAAEALKLPRGFERGLLVRLHRGASQIQRQAREALAGHSPAPGRAA